MAAASPALPPWPFDELPGGDLVRQGLLDVGDGRESIPALLARVGGPRLRALGAAVPPPGSGEELPEHRLYLRLAADHGDAAHGRYNALVRLLVSFERAVSACVR